MPALWFNSPVQFIFPKNRGNILAAFKWRIRGKFVAVRWKPNIIFALKIDKQLRIAWVNLFEHRWVNDAPELTEAARLAITDANNLCCLSVASCWEMAIKSSLGKLRLARPLERFIRNN